MRRGIRVDQEEKEERGRARVGKLSFCKSRREEDNKAEKRELQSSKFAYSKTANYGMKMRRGIRVAQEEREEWGRARAGKFSLCKLRRGEDKLGKKSCRAVNLHILKLPIMG